MMPRLVTVMMILSTWAWPLWAQEAPEADPTAASGAERASAPTTRPAGDADEADAAADPELDIGVRDLMRESFSAPAESTEADARGDLSATLRRLRAMRLGAERPKPKDAEPEPEEPTDTTADGRTEDPAEPEPEPAEAPAPGLDAATLETLRTNVPPDSVADPLALADTLFRAGHLDTAAVFYQLALRRDPSPADKAWILFQTGNSLRTRDPAAARAAYKQVMAEHAESPWAEPARTQDELIAWEQSTRPREFLREVDAIGPVRDEPAPDATSTPTSTSATEAKSDEGA